MSEPPPIRTERRGAALWIWIDREARRNAMNGQVLAGIEAAVRKLDADVRCVVLTGAGRRAFCAGADLSVGTGTFITQWIVNTPTGIAVDNAGNVYVADFFNNLIQKFTNTGAYLTQWGAFGSGEGHAGRVGR